MKATVSAKKEKRTKAAPPLDFSAQTPKIAVRVPHPHPLYEKAFLTPGKPDTSDHSRNTATFDR